MLPKSNFIDIITTDKRKEAILFKLITKQSLIVDQIYSSKIKDSK